MTGDTGSDDETDADDADVPPEDTSTETRDGGVEHDDSNVEDSAADGSVTDTADEADADTASGASDGAQSDGDAGDPDGSGGPGAPGGADEPYRRDVDPERVEYLASELAELQAEVDDLEGQVADKTVHRDDVEAELRRYVRARQRKGHATGWGPYLVLLYGVFMTLGAFYYLGNVWAILAMIVVWLSTLGLYVFMAIFSTGITLTRRVAALRDIVGRRR